MNVNTEQETYLLAESIPASQMSASAQDRPTAEEEENVLLACRYGDDEDVRAFVSRFGLITFVRARDERGNSVLHMLCANGHDGTSRGILMIVLSEC